MVSFSWRLCDLSPHLWAIASWLLIDTVDMFYKTILFQCNYILSIMKEILSFLLGMYLSNFARNFLMRDGIILVFLLELIYMLNRIIY